MFLQRGLIGPRWRKVVAVPEAAVTDLCSPDDGFDGHPKHVESGFSVNKYMRTVASCWILLTFWLPVDFKQNQCNKGLVTSDIHFVKSRLRGDIFRF